MAGTSDTPFPPQMVLPFGWQSPVHNVAVSGQTLAVAGPAAAANVDTLFIPGAQNICFVWLGTNDIALNGTSPVATYALLTSYIADRHAKGFKVITATMLSRINFETQKNVYNPLILANTGGAQGAAGKWDALVDYTGTLLGCDGCSTNLGLFQSGGVHPNQTGVDTIEVPPSQAAINSQIH